MSKYVVHLLQPLDMPARTVAFHAAPHLRVEADRLEQVLARGPGVVTQPTSRTEAQRVADILAAAGAPAQVRPASSNPELSPTPSGSSAGASDFSNLPNRREPTRRLSLRGKLLLLTLLPVLLLSGATLYVGFGAVRELSTTLSASWADALALTLASDISATVAQNGLAVGRITRRGRGPLRHGALAPQPGRAARRGGRCRHGRRRAASGAELVARAPQPAIRTCSGR